MSEVDIRKEIVEVLDDDLKALKEEISDKEEEIETNEDYEMYDDDLDLEIDGCYDEVEILNVKYPMSEVIKVVNNSQYEDFRNDFTNTYIEDNRDELESEKEDLESELEDLEESYKEEFEDED